MALDAKLEVIGQLAPQQKKSRRLFFGAGTDKKVGQVIVAHEGVY